MSIEATDHCYTDPPMVTLLFDKMVFAEYHQNDLQGYQKWLALPHAVYGRTRLDEGK